MPAGTEAASPTRVEAAWSVRELVLGVRRGELAPAEIVEECLRRIERNADLNALLWADPERIRAQVGGRGSDGRPLEGVPLALKDNIDTAGIPTTSGSLVDRARIPDVDAPVWARLRDRGGAVLAGKAHMSEYAYRSHHPGLGRVCNPRRPDRATGGSSSGSAAAVAAGIVPAALGTDTGGSVRIPASYCGVVGLKGTHGLVETEGVVPLSWTMDHVGVLAGSVTDAAIVFDQMLPSPLRLVDPATLELPRPRPRTLRVGVARGYLANGAQRGVLERWRRSVEQLERAGCVLVPVEVTQAAAWRAAHKAVLLSEAWRVHRAGLESGAPYGEVFRSAVGSGSRISAARYEQALRTREAAQVEIARVLSTVDVLVTPTTPSVAPPLDEGVGRLAYTRYTTLAAFTGVPAISLPAGTGASGLPVGVQLLAAPHAEATLLGAAALLEDLLADVGSHEAEVE